MATWPTTIPQCPTLNAFSEEKQVNVAAFAPDVGPPKIRRRSTAASWLTSVAFRMTTDELADFYAFYEDDLEDGSLPFTWDHPITKLEYSWMFDPKATPKVDRMTPDTFRVSFSLLRLP